MRLELLLGLSAVTQHPCSKFGWGNRESLMGVDAKGEMDDHNDNGRKIDTNKGKVEMSDTEKSRL